MMDFSISEYMFPEYIMPDIQDCFSQSGSSYLVPSGNSPQNQEHVPVQPCLPPISYVGRQPPSLITSSSSDNSTEFSSHSTSSIGMQTSVQQCTIGSPVNHGISMDIDMTSITKGISDQRGMSVEERKKFIRERNFFNDAVRKAIDQTGLRCIKNEAFNTLFKCVKVYIPNLTSDPDVFRSVRHALRKNIIYRKGREKMLGKKTDPMPSKLPTEYMDTTVSVDRLTMGSEVCLASQGFPVAKAKVISYPASEEGMDTSEKEKFASVQVLLKKRNSTVEYLPYRMEMREWSAIGKGSRLGWRVNEILPLESYDDFQKTVRANKMILNRQRKRVAREEAEMQQEHQQEDPAQEMEDPAPGPDMDDPAPVMDDPAPVMDDPAPVMEDPTPGPDMDDPAPGPDMDDPAPSPDMDGPAPVMEDPAPGPDMDDPAPVMDDPAQEEGIPQEEEEPASPELESRVEPDIPICSFEEGYKQSDYVEVAFPCTRGKKTRKTMFFGQIIDMEPLTVAFLKNTDKEHVKVWPDIEDISIVNPTEIVRKLKTPLHDHRDRLRFDVDGAPPTL